MFIDETIFRDRVAAIQAVIAETAKRAGRSANEVTLLPVTKTHPAEAVDLAFAFGFKSVGENRVQEAIEKQSLANVPVEWELIGHLQSNKAKLAVKHFSRIQSVDSIKLINALDLAAGEAGKRPRILLQINAGKDPAKFGLDPADTCAAVELALKKNNLLLEGFMTIAPLSDDSETARRTFENLREIRDEAASKFGTSLRELSMGMSGDLVPAVRAGSTMIRVGAALFGSRS